MKVNRELIKQMLTEAWRNNQHFSVNKFLISEGSKPEEVNDAVDLLLSKLDKQTLKNHMNINGNITDSKYEDD